MKNVDVPMWDKGDDTDDFVKGGSSSPTLSFPLPLKEKKSSSVKSTYQLILGREPSSREVAFYKYSSLTDDALMKKLLKSDEHKNILEKSDKYPSLKEENKKSKSSILKLKSFLADKENEFLELKRLLEEKNKIIEDLRRKKDYPFLTDRELLKNDPTYYGVSKESKPRKKENENILDRLVYLLFGDK